MAEAPLDRGGRCRRMSWRSVSGTSEGSCLGDDTRDPRQDFPAEFLAAHGESTALGVGQAKRARAQVLPEDPILLLEIRDQIVLVAVRPASQRENEEL